jgi:DNA polymerase-3 subunit delta
MGGCRRAVLQEEASERRRANPVCHSSNRSGTSPLAWCGTTPHPDLPPPGGKELGLKLDKPKLEQVLKSPDSIGALLFYGPDEGLAHEYAGLAQRAVLGAGDDPFRLAELTPDEIRADGARLADELNAISMLGGRRVVRIAQASNAIAEQIASAIAVQAPGSALLVVEAGDIGTRAELVKVFDSAANAGVFACYRDGESQLGALIASHLKAGGHAIARDAQAYLAERLGGDRGVTRSELDKLMLYVGEPKREITLADAMACIGDRAAFLFDDLIGAAVDGNAADLDRQYALSLSEIGAIKLLRESAKYLQRLHQIVARMALGDSFETAASALRPPLFFKQRDRMQRHVRQWSSARIGRALDLLIEAETEAMRAHSIGGEIAQRALMDIAALARAGRR